MSPRSARATHPLVRRRARRWVSIRTPVRALFFGSIRDYKGVDLLLGAMATLDRDLPLHLTIAGPCSDAGRRRALQAMVDDMPGPERVDAQFDFVADELLAMHLAAADFGVFPFRSVTNSSSVLHALAAGLPVVIPDLPALDDVPGTAALRYDARGRIRSTRSRAGLGSHDAPVSTIGDGRRGDGLRHVTVMADDRRRDVGDLRRRVGRWGTRRVDTHAGARDAGGAMRVLMVSPYPPKPRRHR